MLRYTLFYVLVHGMCICAAMAGNIISREQPSTTPVIGLPSYNNDSLYAVFNTIPAYENTYGMQVKIDVDMLKEGKWLHEQGRAICRLSLHSEHAAGFRLCFDQFELPEHATLTVYDGNHRKLLSYASDSRGNGMNFSTRMIWENEVQLEYVNAADKPETVSLHLSGMTYAYYKPPAADPFFAPPQVTTGISCAPYQIGYNGYCYYNGTTLPRYLTGASLSCYTDVYCHSSANTYCREIRSTVMLDIPYFWIRLYDAGSCTDDTAILYTFATGVLVNNTRNDMTPYILTAGHVVDPAPSFSYRGYNAPCSANLTVYTRKTPPELWNVYYNYQRPECDTNLAGNDRLLTHGIDVLFYGPDAPCESDIALLKVTDNPYTRYDIPVAFDVYYAGFNTASPAAGPITFISHPKGDVKKVIEATICSTCSNPDYFQAYIDNGWGGAQTGMSGSPAFDAGHLVTGLVSQGGPQDVCATALVSIYLFQVTLSPCWDDLKTYLDPDDEEITSLDGYDPLASCRDTVDVYGTLYPAATWRGTNQLVIHAADHIVAPPANLTCLITESPVYPGPGISKQPYQTSSDYIFRAGTQVRLAPGFKVLAGNTFSAQIATCSTYTECTGDNSGGYGKKGAGGFGEMPVDEYTPGPVNENSIEDELVSLSPNPAKDLVHIVFKRSEAQHPGTCDITLTDMKGNKVAGYHQLQGTTFDIDVSAFDEGVYICTIKGDAVKQYKLVIMR